jgi:cell division protein ZapA
VLADMTATNATEVEIFGAVYTVRGEHEPGYLQELAAKVDRDMREIASRVASRIDDVEPGRVAILAALNIADELFRCQRQQEGDRTAIAERMARLDDELRRVLQE